MPILILVVLSLWKIQGWFDKASVYRCGWF